MRLDLAPKLFFQPVFIFLPSLYPARELGTQQKNIAASADQLPVQAPKADLNPNAVTRGKGIGVRGRTVLFLSANFKGSLDEGQANSFAKSDSINGTEN